MSAFPDGSPALSDECPINLHYADPRPNIVDVDAIVRDGRRIRRRRTTTVSLASAAMVAAVVAASLGAAHVLAHRDTVQVAGIYKSSFLKSFPPVDSAVVVLGTYADVSTPKQSAVIWMTQSGGLCYGSTDMSARSANTSFFGSCGSPAPAELTTPGPTTLVPGWPVFRTMPIRPGEFIAIGVLRGTAATVEVTANGQTAEAPVYPLATTNGEAAGAYAVWLRAEPDGSIHSADITSVRALDSAGHVVAQIP
jgi:hypothetical protein